MKPARDYLRRIYLREDKKNHVRYNDFFFIKDFYGGGKPSHLVKMKEALATFKTWYRRAITTHNWISARHCYSQCVYWYGQIKIHIEYFGDVTD